MLTETDRAITPGKERMELRTIASTRLRFYRFDFHILPQEGISLVLYIQLISNEGDSASGLCSTIDRGRTIPPVLYSLFDILIVLGDIVGPSFRGCTHI